ncbi:MAG: TlpA family protein disulfide reductase [Sciscionella sp.]|nr:TlpA family protein disulfide reductase [Sciscionella sp.]
MRSLIGVVLGAALLLAGCATGTDAVDQGSDFQFVAPAGQTKIFYDQNKRMTPPDISGESLTESGKQLKLSDYSHKIIVLNIWGSWCAPCRTETTELQQVAKTTGVQVLGIDVRDNRSAAQDFVHDRGVNYPSIYDFDGRTLLGLNGLPRNVTPMTMIFDKNHRVAAVYLQAIVAADVLPEIHKLAAEK